MIASRGLQEECRVDPREEGEEKEDTSRSGGAPAMGETACSPSCAGRPCGRQQCATVLLVQEVHHHRHQRLRRHHPPRRQRLLPTLTWQMSVMPATREPETSSSIIQGPPEEERRRAQTLPASPENRPRRDRQAIARTTPGSTFTSGARLTLVHYSE